MPTTKRKTKKDLIKTSEEVKVMPDKKSPWKNILLSSILLVLLVFASLLFYNDVYLKSKSAADHFANTAALETKEKASVEEEAKKAEESAYLAVEFETGTEVKRMEEIFNLAGFQNKEGEEPVYTLAFPDQPGFETWYKVKFPIDRKVADIINTLNQYPEVAFVGPVTGE